MGIVYCYGTKLVLVGYDTCGDAIMRIEETVPINDHRLIEFDNFTVDAIGLPPLPEDGYREYDVLFALIVADSDEDYSNTRKVFVAAQFAGDKQPTILFYDHTVLSLKHHQIPELDVEFHNLLQMSGVRIGEYEAKL